MPVIDTDDDARRLRAVWLGPKGMRWPFTARYVAWACWAGMAAVASTVVGSLLWPVAPRNLAGLLLLVAGIGLAGPVLAIWPAAAVMRVVTHDKPVKYLTRALRAEVHAPRPVPAGPTRVSLAPAVRRRSRPGSWVGGRR